MLVVEDEWAIADWLSSLLGDEGYDVVVANNGQRALDLLAAQKPDIVLTDFMMPVMDGPAMLATMAQHGMDIPVIVMSSLPEATVRERCNGHDAFIRKPFREEDLLKTLAAVIESRSR